MILGVDTSSNNSPVSHRVLAAAGYDFAFEKSGEGGTYTNPYFRQRWADIRAAGMLRGTYYYWRPERDPVQQAQHFCSLIDSVGGLELDDLPPVIDFEEPGRPPLSAYGLASRAHTFLDVVEAHTHRVPMLYTYPSYWYSTVGNDKSFARYPLWWASYTVKSAQPAPEQSPRVYGGWSGFTLWQWAVRAEVPGVTGACDLNVHFGDRQSLLTQAGGLPEAHDPAPRPRFNQEDSMLFTIKPTDGAIAIPLRTDAFSSGGAVFLSWDEYGLADAVPVVRAVIHNSGIPRPQGWRQAENIKNAGADGFGYIEEGRSAFLFTDRDDQAVIMVKGAPVTVDVAYLQK